MSGAQRATQDCRVREAEVVGKDARLGGIAANW